jgi:hypothetical protein
MPRRPGGAGGPPNRRAPAVSSKPPAPVPLEVVGPLAALLRQLARQTGSPRVSRWAEALLSRSEAAAGRGAERPVVRAGAKDRGG